MITLFGYKNTRSLRVVWMMEELGQDYKYNLVDFTKGDSQSGDFLKINAAGKIPVMTDNDLLLTESAAIISYLAEKYPKPALIPAAATADRGRYYQWCHFATAELEQPLWTIGKHKFALPKERRVKEIFPTAEWEYQKALKLFSQGLGDKEFILGEQFSGADILLTQTLLWGLAFKQRTEQQNLLDYLNRNKQRPAFSQAVAREHQEAI